MKASDLRIGNLVEYNGITFQVYSIQSPEPMQDERFSDKYLVTLSGDGLITVTIDEIKPITLTEEWLAKFSLSQQGKRPMWVKGKVCVVLARYLDLKGYLTDKKFYIGFKDLGNVIFHTTIECEHVHTLQNAVALIGEELTIR